LDKSFDSNSHAVAFLASEVDPVTDSEASERIKHFNSVIRSQRGKINNGDDVERHINPS
jgi:hypothetical protein